MYLKDFAFTMNTFYWSSKTRKNAKTAPSHGRSKQKHDGLVQRLKLFQEGRVCPESVHPRRVRILLQSRAAWPTIVASVIGAHPRHVKITCATETVGTARHTYKVFSFTKTEYCAACRKGTGNNARTLENSKLLRQLPGTPVNKPRAYKWGKPFTVT